jgi:hypothetical protein
VVVKNSFFTTTLSASVSSSAATPQPPFVSPPFDICFGFSKELI